MPAYRERVYICPENSGSAAGMVEFPAWWDRRAFFDKYRERMIDTGNPFYVNYGLLLTPGEAMEFDRQCREGDGRPAPTDEAGRWEALLREARWVIVESYEWESGLE